MQKLGILPVLATLLATPPGRPRDETPIRDPFADPPRIVVEETKTSARVRRRESAKAKRNRKKDARRHRNRGRR